MQPRLVAVAQLYDTLISEQLRGTLRARITWVRHRNTLIKSSLRYCYILKLQSLSVRLVRTRGTAALRHVH